MIEINGVQIDEQFYIDKWTNWALRTTPATDEQVIQNVQKIYEKVGFEKPEVKVYREWEDFISNDWASVGDFVGDFVRDSVWDSVGDSVRHSVWNSVGTSVEDSVRDSVWASVGNSVWISVGDSVGNSVWNFVGAWYWADDLSFADVFVRANVLSKDKAQELEEWRKLLETQRISVLTEKVAYVLVAPILSRENGKLHSTTQPAVLWGKTGLYYLHGVSFDKELWTSITENTITAKEVLSLKNVEQRMATIKVLGINHVFEQLNVKLLDKSERGNELYLVENVFSQPAKFVKKVCPSTGRVYVEGVDPSIQGADEAIAWQMDISPQEYTLLKMES